MLIDWRAGMDLKERRHGRGSPSNFKKFVKYYIYFTRFRQIFMELSIVAPNYSYCSLMEFHPITKFLDPSLRLKIPEPVANRLMGVHIAHLYDRWNSYNFLWVN